MTEVQQWLNEKHPLNQREQVEEINNSYGGELTGELTIESFPNLKKINLAKNKNLAKLIIRNCPQVEKIDVQNNQITELFINSLTNLEYLNCSNNRLTKLDIELNTKIKELHFFGNPQLRRENIKGLEKLTQLVSFKCDEGLQLIQLLQNQLQQARQQVGQIQQELQRKTNDYDNSVQECNRLQHQVNELNRRPSTDAHERVRTELEEMANQRNNLQTTITNVQNSLGINNLNQLPTIPQGKILQDLINFYNTQQQPRQQENNNQTRWLQRRNQELITEIQAVQERLAVFEILSLEEKIRIQKNYVESLKTKARIRLDPNLHEILKDLLEAQEALAKGDDNRFAQRLFDRSKQDLVSWLPERETDKLLQAIFNLSTLEWQQKQEQQQALIEVPTRHN